MGRRKQNNNKSNGSNTPTGPTTHGSIISRKNDKKKGRQHNHQNPNRNCHQTSSNDEDVDKNDRNRTLSSPMRQWTYSLLLAASTLLIFAVVIFIVGENQFRRSFVSSSSTVNVVASPSSSKETTLISESSKSIDSGAQQQKIETKADTPQKEGEIEIDASGNNMPSRGGFDEISIDGRGGGGGGVNGKKRKERVDNPVGQSFSQGNFEVLEVLPHDKKAFTQGLTYHNGSLFEGTGLNGKSKISRLNLSHDWMSSTTTATNPLTSRLLPHHYFGEGITYFPEHSTVQPLIAQITWKENTGFIYNASTLEQIREFTFRTTTGEGWGITYDNARGEFIVSDGGEYLHFWDGITLEERRRVRVLIEREDGEWFPVQRLNELEFVRWSDGSGGGGTVLANVWYQDVLLEIDHTSGKVLKVYDFKTLYQNRERLVDCFNGVSISGETDEDDYVVYVTGKFWPYMFKVRLL